MSIVVLSGNPRRGSRTAAVAQQVANAVAAVVDLPVTTVELADVAPVLFTPADPELTALREAVARATVVVVATPSYKGSYTGLLKAFIDGYGPDSLAGVTAIPVVIAGTPRHTTLVAEIHLRPLLDEIGASTSLGCLAFTEAEVTDAAALAETIAAWAEARTPLIRALSATRVTTTSEVSA
ncbi:NADPH-dependent FMN reductase [Salinibacterium hongtaonis]|uniref:FMN reductase n=1 Tax=Homoserinimonas hongtaonis TaxID=2079791 RepID=A0A2U1T2Z6_9MICO|nr:NAD(P)H-dependent oxidoreductase [Salinibacterium hongtaonis]PWB98236.1 FMN reductase [Salinibacterium hongtaonis]